MKEYLKKFFKNVKSYIDYIMKLGFKDLFVHFVEIIVLVILASLIYLPIGLIDDLLFQVISIVINSSVIFVKIYDLIFSILSAILAIFAFIYMFNIRYEDIEKIRNNKNDVSRLKLEKDDKAKQNVVLEEIELPKKKKG